LQKSPKFFYKNVGPQVSSVLYEPPIPSKGVNFFNFKSLKDNSAKAFESSEDLPDKSSFKRDQPVYPADPSSFGSFFNSQAIDEEIKDYQEKLKGENGGKPENSIEFEQPFEASKLLKSKLYIVGNNI
jgi:hypothetical protein